MRRPKSLNVALKAADTEVQQYVIQLESENLKLHKQIAKFQVRNVSQQHEIAALRREMKALQKNHDGLTLNINVAPTDQAEQSLASDAQ